MDLSFSRFEADTRVTAMPPDLAVLMVGIFARQAASPTAMAQTRIAAVPVAKPLHGKDFAPAHGAFNRDVAEMFIRWQKE